MPIRGASGGDARCAIRRGRRVRAGERAKKSKQRRDKKASFRGAISRVVNRQSLAPSARSAVSAQLRFLASETTPPGIFFLSSHQFFFLLELILELSKTEENGHAPTKSLSFERAHLIDQSFARATRYKVVFDARS